MTELGVVCGNSGVVNTSWNGQLTSVEFHRFPLGSIKFHGFSSKSMDFHRPWPREISVHGGSHLIDVHGCPWNSLPMGSFVSTNVHGCPWMSVEVHRSPWKSMEVHRCSWMLMEVYRCP